MIFGIDKRIFLVGLVLVSVAFSFWAGSRVPALNEKALMGGDIQLTAIGFDTVLPVSEEDPVVKRILYSTVNWVETNRKGMTFGVVFAAILMTLLSLFRKKSLKSGFSNSLMGMTIGAPLGVCVNCAAPIATGLYSAGARVETTLAAMMSSPTLNIIVLTILLSVFPTYMVVIKLALTLGFILIIIPLLAKYLGSEILVCEMNQACDIPLGMSDGADNPVETWWEALVWTVRNLLKNFWFVVVRTVPLMFLAGFLGAAAITLLPWESLANIFPSGNVLLVLMAMGAIGVFGLFLPVPIAFDVLVSAILLAAGMPVKYVMVLLFTLGIFSVYSFSIVWKTIDKRMAVVLSVVLVAIGVSAGIIGDRYSKWDQQRKSDLFFSVFNEAAAESDGVTTLRVERLLPPDSVGMAQSELVAALQSDALIPVPVRVDGPPNVSVARIDFQDSDAEPVTGFRRYEGSELGIDEQYSYSVYSLATLSRFRGIASGDVHNDGWVDVVLTSDRGLSVFANRAGTGFSRQDIAIPGLDDQYVVNAALVDLNNDGWLDLFYSTFRDGDFVVYNAKGEFHEQARTPVPNQSGAIMAASAGFGDIDGDGDLDAILGNWSLGFLGDDGPVVSSSRNALLMNGPDGFQISALDGITGETLSTLLSDLDGDDVLDLIVGNDLRPPDEYYLGNGDGSFDRLLKGNSLVTHSTRSTMSITTADINNDLVPELYLAQISGMSGAGDLEVRGLEPEICDEVQEPGRRKQCVRFLMQQKELLGVLAKRDVFQCAGIDPEFRTDCFGINLLYWAMMWHKDAEKCAMFPDTWEAFSFMCNRRFGERTEFTDAQRQEAIPQISQVNLLLVKDDQGGFVDQAKAMGVQVGGWSWNAKFADVDNDEWQDLFVVNGAYFSRKREPNIFYHNEGGERFEDRSAQYGVGSFLATSAYTYIDMDNDGDLDIISVPAAGPTQVLANDQQNGKSISVALRDAIGNHFGIGSKIFIYYGEGESRHQVRELQSSGGFASFDAPIAHFGLGQHDRVSRIEVVWSDGERSEIVGDFPAGARYIFNRGGGEVDVALRRN